MNFESLVDKYQRLTDMKTERESEIKKINEARDKIKAMLLEVFNEKGIDSVKTPLGTVYRSTRTFASVADWDIFRQYVQEHDLWNLIERRCSSKGTEEFMEAHDEPPPGINVSRVATVNIRRS